MLSIQDIQGGDIEFSGRLDASQTDQADAALARITASRTLDFKKLEYISSAGLGILLAHQQRLTALGSSLKLKNLNKHIRDVFMYTGFDRIFEIEQ